MFLSKSSTRCAYWDIENEYNGTLTEEDKNFCRNPNGEHFKPFCQTSNGGKEECDIDECGKFNLRI